MKKKKKLCLLVESLEYMEGEPYQRNLIPALESLRDEVDLRVITLASPVEQCDLLWVALKMRNTVSQIGKIKECAAQAKRTVVQDYDPWVFYDSSSPHCGGYNKISAVLPQVEFYVPNFHWSRFIQNDTGKRVHSGLIGPSWKDCRFHVGHYHREHQVPTFYGSDYPIRRQNFEALRASGVPVQWSTEKVPYAEFNGLLDNISIWCHHEAGILTLAGGDTVPRYWLWPKALEVLCRGTLLLRSYDAEALFYCVDTLPSAFLYKDLQEAAELYRHISGLSVHERDNRSAETVARIAAFNIWGQFARQVKEIINEYR